MNKYKEIKTLGKGSFGRAALVEELATKKQYVMKIIQISQMSPKEQQEALLESKILQKLNHPNITFYKESFTDNKFLYIVMEYANSGDLYTIIKNQKAKNALFPEKQIWHFFIQICLGLKHVHDRRILHRDLKTQNVFLTTENKQLMVKLGDFGVSKVLNSTMECAKTAIGTPYYLSPELCNNQGYNNKSDIWALGCILYELCTLNHTFEAANMKMLIVKILEGKYKQISSNYSKDLKDLLTMMLQKDPKKRPSVNSILKMPFIQQKLSEYLPENVKEMEFAHTVFHGNGNIMKGFKEEEEIKQIMGGEQLFGAPQVEPTKVVVQPPQMSYPTNVKQTPPIGQKIPAKVPQIKAQSPQKQAPIAQKQALQPQQSSVPSDATLFNKLNELDDLLAMKSPSSNQVSPSNQQYNPFSYPTQNQVQTPQPKQPVPNPLAYNPPPSYVQKQEAQQKNLNQHQKDVISKLAPMNDRDKARYMREKELQDKRERAAHLKRQSEEKIANAKAGVRQKYEKINQVYDQQMNQKKEKMYRDEEDLARRAKILEENKKAENLAKKQYELEQKRINAEIAEKERKKGEDQRDKLRKMMADKRKEKQGMDVEILEEKGAAQKMREKYGENGQNYQQECQSKQIVKEVPKQQEIQKQDADQSQNQIQDEESESFGDAPDANFANANDAEKWKMTLNSENSKESLCYRMESLRSFMEKELGFDVFINAYQAIHSANEEDREFDQQYMNKLLANNMGYMNLIVQLILVEQKFNESQ